jgi:hypothetical protein
VNGDSNTFPLLQYILEINRIATITFWLHFKLLFLSRKVADVRLSYSSFPVIQTERTVKGSETFKRGQNSVLYSHVKESLTHPFPAWK